MLSIQRLGSLDALLRSVESETSATLGQPQADDALDLQIALSELWVGSAYEILRVMNQHQRSILPQGFKDLFRQFTLLRVAMEKYELMNDREMRDPLRFYMMPPQDETDFVDYNNGDPMRAHIMQTETSNRGSVQWLATDWQRQTETWLERRELADKLVALLSSPVKVGDVDQKDYIDR